MKYASLPFMCRSVRLKGFLLVVLAASMTPAFSGAPSVPPAVIASSAVAPLSAEEAFAAEQQDCLATALCALKPRIGVRSHQWGPATCQTIAASVVDSAARHDLSPALLVAVMINESDLNETATRTSTSRGRLAKDSGLMGIRCVLDQRGNCTTGLVRGMPWRRVMDPVTNIELGARYLAHYRDGAARMRAVVRVRDAQGDLQRVDRQVRCRHRDHAWWAHYNHGTRYIAKAPARDYPRHVGVLYRALADTLAYDRTELNAQLTSGRGAPRGDGKSRRHVALAAAIRSATATCEVRPTYASAAAAGHPRL